MYTLLELFSIILVEKYGSLKVVKNPFLKNRFLAALRSFFSTYIFFQGGGGYFAVSKIKEQYF